MMLLEVRNLLSEFSVLVVEPRCIVQGGVHDQKALTGFADVDQWVQDFFVPPLFDFEVVDAGPSALFLPRVKNTTREVALCFIQWEYNELRTQLGELGPHRVP